MRSPQSKPLPLTAGLVLLWSFYLAVSVVFRAGAAEESFSTATNGVVSFQLRAAAPVDGSGIFLSQLLESGPKLPALRLGDAPAFGGSLLLKRGEITELARSAGLDKPLTNWTGPQQVRVSRRARSLKEREMVQLLTSVLQKQFIKEEGELELRLSRPWTSVEVPDEPLALKVLDLPTSGLASVVIARFEFETANGEHIGPWQAPLQAKIWREIWVAGSTLKRGDLLVGADLHRERRDMLLCREPLAEFAPGNSSLEFCETVPAGCPIFARFVRPRAIVHRGQSLVATVQDGALMITLKVEALEDGAAGQIIRVRNPLSRRDLHGKVLNDETILVSL